MGPRCLKGDPSAVPRMGERQLPGMQTERRVLDRDRLHVAELVMGPIQGVADNRPAEVPEMHANLVGPPGLWLDQKQ